MVWRIKIFRLEKLSFTQLAGMLGASRLKVDSASLRGGAAALLDCSGLLTSTRKFRVVCMLEVDFVCLESLLLL